MILILFILFLSANGQPCSDVNSVDITDGEVSSGTIKKDGVDYTSEFVYKKNVSGEIKSFGCLCEFKNCFRKCCPVGSVRLAGRCVVMPEADQLKNNGVDLYYFDSFKENVGLISQFAVVHGWPCDEMYEETAKWYVQKDGQLFIELPNAIPPWTLRGSDKYCIDTFVTEDPTTGVQTPRLDALICFADTQESPHYLLSSTCMLISCVFILATVAVYSWLPELRNLHGRVLMAYLLCLFVGFAALSTMQIMLKIENIYQTTCLTLTIIIYFSLESAFFWLNVMCFDIWWTFSGKRGLSNRLSSTKARFLAYCVYAFGISTVLTVLLISLEFSGLPPHPMMPMIRHQGCFLYGNSKLIYLYSPMMLVCLSNMVFFVLTALKINEIKKQTSVLKSKDNSTHDQHRKDKQRLTLYVKLFMVMGISWILEVISAIYPDIQGLWNITDAYNVLIGLIIFIIFVCKRKIFRLIKKRLGSQTEQTSKVTSEKSGNGTSRLYLKYKQLRGEPMSRTQTTTSSRTLSTREKDDVPMGSMKSKF